MSSIKDDFLDITIVQDPLSLSTEDLIEEYDKIKKSYSKAKNVIDSYRQKMHQLNRNMELSGIRENELKDELQSIAEVHEQELIDERKKFQCESNGLRNRLDDVKATNEQLESEVERLKLKIEDSAKNVRNPVTIEAKCDPNETIVSVNRLDYLVDLETKYFKLIDERNELKAEISELNSNAAQAEVMLLFCFKYVLLLCFINLNYVIL